MGKYKFERQTNNFTEGEALELLHKYFPQGYWYEASRDKGIIRVNILFNEEDHKAKH
tara:strand:+ start:1692 stop:1862 length:171 start_codon:yes stop_codon:yes gene_type:complete